MINKIMKRSSIMDSFSNITKPVLKTFFCLFASLIFIYSIIFSAPTASADIATGLISHYKLDETSGSTASDSAGANTGTVSGATFTTGKISNGLNLNGTTDYVSVPRMNYNEISVSAWFYKSVNDTVNADAIWGGWYWSSNPSNRQGFDLRFYQSAPDTLSFLLETIGATTTEKTSSYALSPSTGAWHHAVATYESVSGNQKLYVDGILRSTVLHPAGATIKPLAQYADMRIGYSRINSGYFNGKIDDVRIYNRALSATDVTELYNANKPAVTTNAAANITSTSATLNGTVNPNGLASTAYFEYGLTSGTYSITTATQNLTGSNTQNLTANISSLTASTIYYYRAVATNSLGTTNGQEQSFTTTVAPDTTLPSISITYPTTNSTYSATSSTVSLSGTASDNVGVTSVTWTNSANSTSGTASGTTSWSIASIPLVSGNNLITVIAKDATNNQSTDTITVDYSTISAGLISYWKLDEISGTTASDSTGSNTGTVTGATWTTAKINNGLSFNGTSNYLNVANNSTLT
ncbi:MAG: hypothetical protein HW401_795, partial [Parcubacteria group bacterium]|nr:hypothetical protein [Parcubacteria group bacterium]